MRNRDIIGRNSEKPVAGINTRFLSKALKLGFVYDTNFIECKVSKSLSVELLNPFELNIYSEKQLLSKIKKGVIIFRHNNLCGGSQRDTISDDLGRVYLNISLYSKV